MIDHRLEPKSSATLKLRSDAWRGCEAAGAAHIRGEPFDVDSLSERQRIAAHTLMHMALSHYLSSPGKLPKTMRWLGKLWYLRRRDFGRLEVMVYQYTDSRGLVSQIDVLPDSLPQGEK